MNQLPEDPCMQEIQRLRADYEAKRARSNLDSAGDRRCIRLADIPGTISGDILRLKQNLPDSVDHGDHEIIGDKVRPILNPPPPPELDDDSEELDTILASLPIVDVDSSKRFVKKGKYKSEIRNLLECEG
ncbi:uncharacterized protein N7529_002046 [Penicillium soppii]|uniref:uncharacterized protein n=1 Tax=Penicillium soppii TaxID=69789 RepID=UPI00254856B0|nr:uncharacterized protein N7529_002046 [Penicillium soppii]KAJ5876462.1 hypothetical protein N7529_002046 [Penicillium soppii]